MADMAVTEILPVMEEYILHIAETAAAKKAVDKQLGCGYEREHLEKLSDLAEKMWSGTEKLKQLLQEKKQQTGVQEESYFIRDNIIKAMNELRAVCDEAEKITAKKYWPFPTYGELLFSVN